MNPLGELMTSEILAQNDQRRNDPIPTGAIASVEDLMDFVNTHQVPTPADWRPSDVYELAHDRMAFLKEARLADTMAVIHLVSVPHNPRHSYLRQLHVPAFTELTHNPDGFGISVELDRKRSLERRLHFATWERIHNQGQQYSLRYQHVETMGLVPDKRNNDWATFRSMEDAENYLEYIKNNARPQTPISRYILRELQNDISHRF